MTPSSFWILQIMAWSIAAADFFVYQDCDLSCQQNGLPCTIGEVNLNFFPCHCYDDEQNCLSVASDTVVCLRKFKSPVGGTAIFDDFKRHRDMTTTTEIPTSTSQPPSPTPTDRHVKIYLSLMIAFAAVSLISITLNGLLLYRSLPTALSYRRIENPRSPYQDTVEPIQDEPGE